MMVEDFQCKECAMRHQVNNGEQGKKNNNNNKTDDDETSARLFFLCSELFDRCPFVVRKYSKLFVGLPLLEYVDCLNRAYKRSNRRMDYSMPRTALPTANPKKKSLILALTILGHWFGWQPIEIA